MGLLSAHVERFSVSRMQDFYLCGFHYIYPSDDDLFTGNVWWEGGVEEGGQENPAFEAEEKKEETAPAAAEVTPEAAAEATPETETGEEPPAT